MRSLKMLTQLTVLLVVVAAAAGAEQRVRFDDYRVYRVQPTTAGQLAVLQQLQRDDLQLQFWKDPVAVSRAVDVMTSPQREGALLDVLKLHGIPHRVYIEDVQRLIDNERPRNGRADGFDWTDYYPLENLYAWLDSLLEQYPDVLTSIVTATSYEGQQQRGVRLSYKEGNPVIFVESGAHAREWIAVSVATYLLNELLTSTNETIRNIAENFDWHIVPSINPDGYEYSHTTNRMWRKTRSIADDRLCVGTDPNRNWDYYWGDEGASNISCGETFMGSSVFSESETRELSEYLQTISDDMLVYFCLHSYSQLLMIPYGLNYERPDNYDELMEIGAIGVEALAQRYGTFYEYGTIYDIIYPASGGSIDWVKKALGTRFVYEWELRDLGEYGFLLPADQIVPTALETIDSIVAILAEVQARTAA